MRALGYDSALRREEPCWLRTDGCDPTQRHPARCGSGRSKARRVGWFPIGVDRCAARGVPAAPRDAQPSYGPVLLSESRRNRGEPQTSWAWSKVVRPTT
jgi:hypothetical protein